MQLHCPTMKHRTAAKVVQFLFISKAGEKHKPHTVDLFHYRFLSVFDIYNIHNEFKCVFGMAEMQAS